MATSLLKPNLKTALLEALYSEILSNSSNYYYFLGKTSVWPTEGVVPAPISSQAYEMRTREEMVFLKKVTSADVSYTIPRYDWEAGVVFDQYDDNLGYFVELTGLTAASGVQTITGSFDTSVLEVGSVVSGTGIATGTRVTVISPTQLTLSAPTTGAVSGILKFTVASESGATSLDTSRFYCLTTDYNVYKCINNNNGAESTIKPYGTSYELLKTSDGYTWKYMYTVPKSLVNRFTTVTEIPVTTALKNQYYSRGSLTSATIVAQGTSYNSTDTLSITGDGYLEENPFKILSTIIVNPGEGYLTTPDVTYSDPFESAEFATETPYILGQYVKNADTNIIYEVVGAGTSGGAAPTHTSVEPVFNGSCVLKFVGKTPTVTATITDGVVSAVATSSIIGYINVTNAGYGYSYTNPPSVVFADSTGENATASVDLVYQIPETIEALFAQASGWVAETSVALNAYVHVNNNLYRVTTAGTTGTTPPVHRTGTETDGDAEMLYVGSTDPIGRVARILITDRGLDYSPAATVTITPPYNLATQWSSGGTVTPGEIVRSGDRFYEVTSGTELGTIQPSHNGGSLANGDTELNFVGQTATASIEFYYGYGYKSVPTITTGETFEPSADWSAGAAVDTDSYVRVNRIIYKVTDGGTLGTTEPTHTTGTEGNGTADLQYTGLMAEFSVIGEKTSAKLTPIVVNGQIVNVIAQDPGVGYTTASIIPQSPTADELAQIEPNISFGDLNSRQANIELLANNGSLDSIIITNPGSNISACTVTITGDGSGAVVRPQDVVITNGRITKISVFNPGSGYTHATITITSNEGSLPAYARCVVSPPGGHGRDAVRELFAQAVTFSASVAVEKNQGFIVNNDYHQIGIIKNPERFNSTLRYNSFTGSTCYSVTGTFSIEDLSRDGFLYDAATGGNVYNIIDIPESGGDSITILIQSAGNTTLSVGQSLYYASGETRLPVVITGLTYPSVNKYSGDLLFIDNKGSFQPTGEQTVSIKTAIRL